MAWTCLALGCKVWGEWICREMIGRTSQRGAISWHGMLITKLDIYLALAVVRGF